MLLKLVFFWCSLQYVVEGRIHVLPIEHDERSIIMMSSFGYLKGGSLEVNITGLMLSAGKTTGDLGFSLDMSSSSETLSYVEREESAHGCILNTDQKTLFTDVPRAIFKVDMKDGVFYVKVSQRGLSNLKIYANYAEYIDQQLHDDKPEEKPPTDAKIPTTTPEKVTEKNESKSEDTETAPPENPASVENEPPAHEEDENTPRANDENKGEPPATEEKSRRKRDAVGDNGAAPDKPQDEGFIHVRDLSVTGGLYAKNGLNLSFYVRMDEKESIGLYELYFHNCENIRAVPVYESYPLNEVAFTAHIVEKNDDNYLSAGDMALPAMYGAMSVLFFLSGIVWLNAICRTKEQVFKIHYLMAVIIFVKGLSVLFHSLDYYFIAKDGRTEAWAVIFYVIHLLKGILLIICLLLIASGWAFIKYILSDRDKKLFMIVIPMQVMANVAYIIMEETEEGNKSYQTWKNIVILVDVLCIGAILIPVVWSIRHLQEASQTDGKAAINLQKLELFRHFYILVVCYLYFTRIIVYLLEITLPFHYIWIHALFSEVGAFLFFSVTGYKFRPGCDNPYLKLEQYDSDDPEEAITQSGAMENVTKVNQTQKDVDETDEFDVLLPKQRTSKM